MKRACSHCHLEYEESALFKENINGKDEFFCCKGCEGVFKILSESNLNIFYDKLGSSTLAPPKDYDDDLNKYDSEIFIKKYIKKINENCAEISLILEGIHCIACVWLNEKVLNNADGIISLDINYTNNKAKITYNPHKITPREIILKIRSIGYNAQVYDPKTLEGINKRARKEYYTRMIVGIFCTMNIMWIAVAQYSGYFLGMEMDVKNILNAAAFLLCTPTLFYSGWIFFRGGYYGLKNGIINMDLLVSIGASLTYFYSIYAALTHSGETYFESATMIITFVLIGKFLEVRARQNAGDKIDNLSGEIPSSVNVFENGKLVAKSPENVAIGDIINVVSGEKIIIDGILLSKNALLDTSALSGESVFVEKKEGESIISGSINMDYNIRYRATKIFLHSTMNNIITLIEESINNKPRIQEQSGRLSYYFSGFIFIIALATFCAWWYFAHDIERAMVVAVSVIIIACPCALALATPIAVIVGISEAYKHRLLFKEAQFLEVFSKTNTIIFDKTGTLTHGKPKVVNLEVFGEFSDKEKIALYEIMALNNHPISAGVREYLEDKISRIDSINITEFKQISHRGISARYKDIEICGGSYIFMQESGIFAPEMQDSHMSFYVAINGELAAIFSLEDTLRGDAHEAIRYFKNNNMRVVILSGDRREVVEKIARELNVDEYYFAQSPIDKSEFIDKLRADGHKVVMVGDGLNDAIALNKSDIAIAMGRGSDVAIDTSDIVLLDDRLKSLIGAHKLSKKTYCVIRQNIGISIVYNLITIPLATLGFIIPLFAALSMSFSSLLVTLNSLKIKIK